MKPYIFTLVLIFSFGLLSCSSDDNVNPEPPTFTHPLDGKWTWEKKIRYPAYGNPPIDYNYGDIIFDFKTEINKVNIQLAYEDPEDYYTIQLIFPFFQNGEYDYILDEENQTITFHLEYIPPYWNQNFWIYPYRFENEVLILGEEAYFDTGGGSDELILVRYD